MMMMSSCIMMSSGQTDNFWRPSRTRTHPPPPPHTRMMMMMMMSSCLTMNSRQTGIRTPHPLRMRSSFVVVFVVGAPTEGTPPLQRSSCS